MSGEHSGRYRELRRKVEARSQKLSRWWSLGDWDRRTINLEAVLHYIARTYLQKSATILNWQTRGAHFNRSMVGMSTTNHFLIGFEVLSTGGNCVYHYKPDRKSRVESSWVLEGPMSFPYACFCQGDTMQSKITWNVCVSLSGATNMVACLMFTGFCSYNGT